MPRITPVERETASEEVAKLLEVFEKKWGESWNVTKTIANSPALLRIFRAFGTELPKTSLGDLDREVIDLQMAVLNGCHYCVPAHIKLSRETGLAEDDIRAIVEGRLMNDPRGRLIQELTRRLVETRGGLSDAEFQSFLERGVTMLEMQEVIGEIAHCTLTNYTNRLARTQFDDFLKDVSV